MVRQTLSHRWRDAQSLVDAAKIEMGDEQTDRRKMVVSALAKAVCEPSEAPGGHAELAFGIAGRNVPCAPMTERRSTPTT